MSERGYLSECYAASLADIGAPTALPASGGWCVRRPLPDGSRRVDAMGSYPLLVCEHWPRLADDLRALDGVVSFVAVIDPLGDHDDTALRAAFPDVLRPFKDHFVVDLAHRAPLPENHRRNLRRATRELDVEVCDTPARWRDDWVRLYAALVERHDITGPAAFSPTALAAQLDVPGALVMRAASQGRTVGMAVFYEQLGCAHYHLAAYDDDGYKLGASFGIFDAALDTLATRASWLDLGGAAGVHETSGDGLTRFKQGWSTGTRTAYLGGAVLDPDAYAAASSDRAAVPTSFFPAVPRG